MRQVLLNDVKGKLYLHSMPARYETWEEICQSLKENKVSTVVCLTSLEEVDKLSPSYAKAVQKGDLPFEKVTTVITDFGIPEDEEGFFTQVHQITQKLKDGENVLVHCAAGIGRTGMFASCVLQALDLDEVTAVSQVKAAGSGAETEVQRDLISRFK